MCFHDIWAIFTCASKLVLALGHIRIGRGATLLSLLVGIYTRGALYLCLCAKTMSLEVCECGGSAAGLFEIVKSNGKC
jgi:hypothetical protein